jgi:hypothetical protein
MYKENSDPEFARKFFTPAHVDQFLRQAVSTCWMMLPRERRTVANVEIEVRRILDRVLRDLREDAEAFGIDPES